MFIPKNNYPAFFITLNIFRNTEIFLIDDFCKTILQSWKFCEKKYGFKIINYVIMPTHIHFILHFLNKKDSQFSIKTKKGTKGKVIEIHNKKIKNFLKTFRSFTAKNILKELKNENSFLLSRLMLKKEKNRHHWFSLWKNGEYITIINNPTMLKIKQNYIYNNPIKENIIKNIKDYMWVQ